MMRYCDISRRVSELMWLQTFRGRLLFGSFRNSFATLIEPILRFQYGRFTVAFSFKRTVLLWWFLGCFRVSYFDKNQYTTSHRNATVMRRLHRSARVVIQLWVISPHTEHLSHGTSNIHTWWMKPPSQGRPWVSLKLLKEVRNGTCSMYWERLLYVPWDGF